MIKADFITSVKNSLYLMGSNASPSFKDEYICQYLDKAYHSVINSIIESADLTYITNLIESKRLNITDYTGKQKNFTFDVGKIFAIVSGYVYTKYNGGTPIKRPIEVYSNIFIDTLLDNSNYLYFSSPKFILNSRDNNISIIIDSYSEFTTYSCTGTAIPISFKYIKMPTKFIDMQNNDTPLISEIKHLEIADKAAELIANILSPQMAQFEIHNNDIIPR